ncbi:hypothetical protein PUN28_004369 [Cardiocondyla obscurior]|uniref:Uncharacterized protein n=1 Tax=Cardiocondyla obscurior TaxID=286306 RepID=A0AAW2GC58_9HYME
MFPKSSSSVDVSGLSSTSLSNIGDLIGTFTLYFVLNKIYRFRATVHIEQQPAQKTIYPEDIVFFRRILRINLKDDLSFMEQIECRFFERDAANVSLRNLKNSSLSYANKKLKKKTESLSTDFRQLKH